ncbi:MAG: hypothetical protein QM788_06110 [Roseateles sp.]|uniref:hypothetical protein n=1 Tax=Roseateles sp. TaxID=1971397 RepID=UPI0039E9FE82
MIPRLPATPAARAQRKADLLLASGLMREQAVLSLDDVGGRADGLVRRVLVVKAWFSSPLVMAVASGGAAAFAAAGPRRRGKLWRALRWAWLGWQALQPRR